jgi:hypothetical protein
MKLPYESLSRCASRLLFVHDSHNYWKIYIGRANDRGSWHEAEARSLALSVALRGKMFATLSRMRSTATRSCSRQNFKLDMKTELAIIRSEYMQYLREQRLAELTKTFIGTN